MRAVPLDDLERARADRHQRLGHAEEQRAQADKAESGWGCEVVRQDDRDAGHARKLAEVTARAVDFRRGELVQRRDRGRAVVAADEHLDVAVRERKRRPRQQRRQGVRGD